MAKDEAATTEADEESSLDEMPYEALIGELDDVVRQLEASELSLEDSLQAFERGVKLAKAAEVRLDQAEQRVEILTQGDRVEEFSDESGGEGPRTNPRPGSDD